MELARTGKQQNQERLIHLLRKEKEVTKQEIARRLNLSMPTVLNMTDSLLKTGLLEECGMNESTGGRRARTLALKKNLMFGVGIRLGRKNVEMVVTDLMGNVIANQMFPFVYEDKIEWYRTLGIALLDFLDEHKIKGNKVLGVGISIPGIVSESENQLVRSHVFDMEKVSLDRFYKNILFPLVIANDANCGCFSEMDSGYNNFLYVALNESVGGGVVVRRELIVGETWQAGEIGHMILYPEGRPCYCGKKGCADAYLSTEALLEGNETLESFFKEVHAGYEGALERWDRYLGDLAIFLTNLRMITNTRLIIGGEIGDYMEPYLEELENKMAQYDLFARDIDYIYPCTKHKHTLAQGAAMMAMERNLGNLLNS